MTDNAPTVFIGPLPLPVHGQAASTKMLRGRLVADGVRLRVIDSDSGTGYTCTKSIRRIFRIAKSAMTLLICRKTGGTGTERLVPAKDPAALAGAIRDLATDDRRRDEIGKYNRTFAKEELSWTHVAERALEVYETAIRNSRQ